MEHTATLEKHLVAHDDFLFRFRKNLRLESIQALKQFRFLYGLTMVTFGGLLFFIFGFQVVKTIFKFVFPIFFVYVTVKYLTLLPTESFLVIIFLPKKWRYRFLGIAMFYSFFKVFLM